MAIGAPTHSDEDSELSDLDGDDTIGFDSDFRTPSLSAKERAGLAPTLGAGLTRGSGDGDAESFGGDVADPSVAAAPDFGATLCEISCPTSTRAQCAAFSPDGSLLAFGCEDGIVRAHDATTGRPSALFNTATHDDPDAPRGVVTAVRFLRGDGVADDNRADNRANVALVATSGGSRLPLARHLRRGPRRPHRRNAQPNVRVGRTRGRSRVRHRGIGRDRARVRPDDFGARRPAYRPDPPPAAPIASSRCVTWTTPRT